MPAAAINSIRALEPGQHGIRLQVNTLEWLVTVETVQNDVPIQISEYLVGDKSGCIMLKTPVKDLEIGKWVTINKGYTQVVDGSLRLVADDVSTNDDQDGHVGQQVDTSLNVSYERLVKY